MNTAPAIACNVSYRLPALVCAIILILQPATLHAQANYAAFELEREENWQPIMLEDMNGDSRKDIVVSHFEPELGRELHVYHQQADGSFTATPQRIEVKTEIIAIGFADLRPDPGQELVLFANNGVFSLSTSIEGYAGNLKLLAQWDLIAAIPDQEQVQFTNIPADINGDGEIDLLLAGNDEYGLFLGQGNEEFELALSFRTLNEDITPIQRARNDVDLDANLGINAEQGVVVELNVETPTPFANFIEVWNPGANDSSALLRSEQWMPTAVLAHFDGDELLDIAYLNAGDDGLGRMNIHYQNQDNLFGQQADWNGDLDSRGDLELVDLNSDGLTDLLRLSGDGNSWDARFYLNEGGRFDFATPDQVMRFSGYDMNLEVLELVADEPVLVVSFYTVPVVDAIRNASINRTQLIYGRDNVEPGQLFNRRPDSRLEESFSAENVRGLSEQMSLQYDVNGDGLLDALYVTANGTLAAKKIGDQLQIAEQPFWEYVSPRNVFEFEVLQLNDDQLPDLLLRHGTTSTLLVALP